MQRWAYIQSDIKIKPSLLVSDELDGVNVWVNCCDIIFQAEHKLTADELQNVKNDIPKLISLGISVTQLHNNQIRISIDSKIPQKSVLGVLLQQKDVFNQLVANIEPNSFSTQKLLMDALEKINIEIDTFIKTNQSFQIDHELRKIQRRIREDDITTMIELMNQNTLDNLMQRVEAAKNNIQSFLSLYETQIKIDTMNAIACTALEPIITNRLKELKETSEDIFRLKNNPNRILKKLLKPYHLQNENIEKIRSVLTNKQDIEGSYAANYWLFKEIILQINTVKPRSRDVLNQVIDHIINPTFSTKMTIDLLQQLRKLNPLLNPELLQIIFLESNINHSCESRLQGGAGLAGVNDSNAQLRWAYCSQYAINWAAQQFLSNCPLTEIMGHLAKFRNDIAVNEDVNDKNQFGSYRNDPRGDLFSDGTNFKFTATSPTIYADLVNITKRTLYNIELVSPPKGSATQDELYKSKKNLSFNFFSNLSSQKMKIISDCNSHTITISSKLDGLSLPKRIIKYFPGSKEIEVNFSVLLEKDYTAIFNVLNQRFILPLNSPSLPQDEKLRMIGELAYYLGVLYPYKRGSAGITQWVLNGLLKKHFGITVGQISMGENLNIPFEIYAHLTTDINGYKEEFARTISLKLNQSQNKKIGYN